MSNFKIVKLQEVLPLDYFRYNKNWCRMGYSQLIYFILSDSNYDDEEIRNVCSVKNERVATLLNLTNKKQAEIKTRNIEFLDSGLGI